MSEHPTTAALGFQPDKRIELMQSLRERIIGYALQDPRFTNGQLVGEMTSSGPGALRVGWDGSVCNEDGAFLMRFISWANPVFILEVGTWFGLSAHAMAIEQTRCRGEAHIETIDDNDVFAPHPDLYKGAVEFRNGRSSELLRKIPLLPDLIFYDGDLREEDEQILSCIEWGAFFLTHDYILTPGAGEKGNINVERLLKLNPNLHVLVPEGNENNKSVAVVSFKQIV